MPAIASWEVGGGIIELVESRSSAVGEFGKHCILQYEGALPRVLNPPNDGAEQMLYHKIPEARRMMAAHFGLDPEYCRMEMNGGSMASMKHLHVHIILVDPAKLAAAGLAQRRCVDDKTFLVPAPPKKA